MTPTRLYAAIDFELAKTAIHPVTRRKLMDCVERALIKTKEPEAKDVRSVDPMVIINNLCAATGIAYKILASKRKDTPITATRQLAIWLIRSEYGALAPVKMIAKLFNVHYTSVVTAYQKTAQRIRDGEEIMVHYYSVYKKYCDEHRNIG